MNQIPSDPKPLNQVSTPLPGTRTEKKDTIADNDLKGIVDHLPTTVELEQIKSRREDYA